MNPSDNKPITVSELLAATDQNTTSQRKLDANRSNAQKSTGPRTRRGKAFSARNAIKHGLFSSPANFTMDESKEKYEKLLKDLHKLFQPIGRAEELAVEWIAICWWRRQRVWRYENCSNRVSFYRDGKNVNQLYEIFKDSAATSKATILTLKEMLDRIVINEEVPPDVKETFLTFIPGSELLWQRAEDAAREWMRRKGLTTTKLHDKNLAFFTLRAALFILSEDERKNLKTYAHAWELILAEHLIPKREPLDKILRYEITVDRSLNRAMENLERLQQQRTGQPVLPR